MSIKDIKSDIDKLYDHARIANEEMAVIKTDVGWLKDTVKTHGTLLWSILGGIILNLLVAIAFKLWK